MATLTWRQLTTADNPSLSPANIPPGSNAVRFTFTFDPQPGVGNDLQLLGLDEFGNPSWQTMGSFGITSNADSLYQAGPDFWYYDAVVPAGNWGIRIVDVFTWQQGGVGPIQAMVAVTPWVTPTTTTEAPATTTTAVPTTTQLPTPALTAKRTFPLPALARSFPLIPGYRTFPVLGTPIPATTTTSAPTTTEVPMPGLLVDVINFDYWFPDRNQWGFNVNIRTVPNFLYLPDDVVSLYNDETDELLGTWVYDGGYPPGFTVYLNPGAPAITVRAELVRGDRMVSDTDVVPAYGTAAPTTTTTTTTEAPNPVSNVMITVDDTQAVITWESALPDAQAYEIDIPGLTHQSVSEGGTSHQFVLGRSGFDYVAMLQQNSYTINVYPLDKPELGDTYDWVPPTTTTTTLGPAIENVSGFLFNQSMPASQVVKVQWTGLRAPTSGFWFFRVLDAVTMEVVAGDFGSPVAGTSRELNVGAYLGDLIPQVAEEAAGPWIQGDAFTVAAPTTTTTLDPNNLNGLNLSFDQGMQQATISWYATSNVTDMTVELLNEWGGVEWSEQIFGNNYSGNFYRYPYAGSLPSGNYKARVTSVHGSIESGLAWWPGNGGGGYGGGGLNDDGSPDLDGNPWTYPDF